MTTGEGASAPMKPTALPTVVSVSTVTPTANREGAVVLAFGDAEVRMTQPDAFDLQRRLLNAALGLQRATQKVVAVRKTKAARELRRAADIDEQLRDREG